MAEQTARFRDVFAVGEFRVLWIAQTQSRIGDQFARVALALLVFEQTSSAALTALVYASTYLPPLITAPLLAGLADRYSRRTVMWAVDLLRAALIGLMAIPAVPLPVLAVLVVAVSCFDPLFSAARIATLPKVLPGGRYQVGMSISSSTDGIAQIVGFALGGVIVAATGSPHLVLAIDAVSFLVSAALLRWGLRPHLPATESDGTASRASGFALAGIRLVAANRNLMGLAALVWMFGFFVVPEAMAAPYAAEIGGGEAVVGVLMAADVVGMVIGGLLVAKLGTGLRRRLTVPLAIAAGLPFVATLFAPNVMVTVALWALSGLMSATSFSRRSDSCNWCPTACAPAPSASPPRASRPPRAWAWRSPAVSPKRCRRPWRSRCAAASAHWARSPSASPSDSPKRTSRQQPPNDPRHTLRTERNRVEHERGGAMTNNNHAQKDSAWR